LSADVAAAADASFCSIDSLTNTHTIQKHRDCDENERKVFYFLASCCCFDFASLAKGAFPPASQFSLAKTTELKIGE